MEVFEVRGMVGESGEYILGAGQTGSHACYLIYGVMKPGEKGRRLKPGRGHEELLIALKGDLRVTGDREGLLREGQALHLKGEETCWLDNGTDSEALYIIAGGHSEGGHH